MGAPFGTISFPSPAAHWLAVAAGLLLYVLSTRIKRERRPPTAAVGWVLGIIAVPYLVVPAYLGAGDTADESRRQVRSAIDRVYTLPA